MMKSSWWRMALFNLLLAAVLGALLRYAFVQEISWLKFKYFLHAHSHVAMLGWVYMALYAMLVHAFVPAERQQRRGYRWLFWLTQVSVWGMLASFPVQGYGAVSIAFSTMHIVLSYVFAGWLWRDMGKADGFSVQLVRTALAFMVISTLGVWLMGPLMTGAFRRSAFYYMAVQFFLHFQFNGWYLFGVLGLFFRSLERKGMVLSLRWRRWFYGLLAVSCVLTYALAVAWSQPYPMVFVANSLGVTLQLLALAACLKLLWPIGKRIWQDIHGWEKALLAVAFASFVGKTLIQTAVAMPYIAQVAYTIRNYVIGFVHLMLLGAVTAFLLSHARQQQLLTTQTLPAKAGLWLLLAGFALSEGLLFVQGTLLWAAKGFLPGYYEGLFAVSALIPVGVALLLAGQLNAQAYNQASSRGTA